MEQKELRFLSADERRCEAGDDPHQEKEHAGRAPRATPAPPDSAPAYHQLGRPQRSIVNQIGAELLHIMGVDHERRGRGPFLRGHRTPATKQ